MDFLQRLKDEQLELTEKIDKLTAFIMGDKFSSLSKANQLLLSKQRFHMVEYNEILILRIELLS